MDKTIHLWDTEGRLLHRWLGTRVSDLQVTRDGRWMVAACHERKIRVYDLDDKSETFVSETDAITSLSLSADDKYVMVNLSSSEIHVWNLQERRIEAKYTGHKQGKFVIRSQFGGRQQSFIISGSEDNNVYVWNREKRALLETLQGHTGTVNSVAWSPTDAQLFASASDDCTVRIWATLSPAKRLT